MNVEKYGYMFTHAYSSKNKITLQHALVCLDTPTSFSGGTGESHFLVKVELKEWGECLRRYRYTEIYYASVQSKDNLDGIILSGWKK